MTELNEVIEEGGLHSTGKCNQSYGEDAGFIATKGTRAGTGEVGILRWRGVGVVVSFYLD